MDRVSVVKGPFQGRSNVRAAWMLGTLAAAVATTSEGNPLVAQTCSTIRASVGTSGIQANSTSFATHVSPDGRFVLFNSSANNLVPGDSNGVQDAFIHDRDPDANGVYDEANGITARISVNSQGEQGNGFSSGPECSADGRYVIFGSDARNLVPGDTNNRMDAFVHDRSTAQTTRVSVDSSGNQGLYAGGGIGPVDISSDGRYVSYVSSFTNLVPNDNNDMLDVFVHDRWTAETTRVSVSSQGTESNGHSWSTSVSMDAHYICFLSDASNLVPGDTNGWRDVFVHDRITGETARASVDSSGNQANGFSYSEKICPQGRFVVFESSASNMAPGDGNNRTDIFLRDLQLGLTSLVSVKFQSSTSANSDSRWPTISADGRFVAFESYASDLVPGNGFGWDIFVRDVLLSTTAIYSADSNGAHGNGQSLRPFISLDGKHVVFSSEANNLVAGDTNNWEDVFARFCLPQQPTTYCLAKPNSLGCMPFLNYAGIPSATAGNGFSITAHQVLGQKAGLLFYSRMNSAWLPFQGRILCVAPPLHRTPVQVSGGSGTSCSGAYFFDFNVWVRAGQDPTLLAGDQVWAQYWSRDPGFPPPENTGLTNAITFVIGP